MLMKSYVRVGEERDIRLAKRNIDSYERFLLLFNKEYMTQLGTTKIDQYNDQCLIYEVLDFMRNHIDDQVAQSALLHIL